MIQIRYNNSLSFIVTTEAGWSYDKEIVLFVNLYKH